MSGTNTSVSGGERIQVFNRPPITLNNTLISQPPVPMPTIMNQPRIVYIRAPVPWGGINGLQTQGPGTKLIRISNGNAIQQRPMCITQVTNGPHGPGSGNDTKPIPTNYNTTQQSEKTIQYVQSPTSTMETNQSGPRLPYNPIRMVTYPNALGLRPQQMIRPIYQTLRPPSGIPSQPGCQQIRIIQRPSHGIVNPMNVVHTQVILPHQRPSSFQSFQGSFRPNSLQTQSQMCAWPQAMAPASHTSTEATSSSQQSQILSSSQIPSQNWQSIPVNSTNGVQTWHGNQPHPSTNIQSESNIMDLQSQNSTTLNPQTSTFQTPFTTQSHIPNTKSNSDINNVTSSNSMEENINMSSVALHNKLFNNARHMASEQSNLMVHSRMNPPSFTDTQPVDVEYEKLMASVGIT